MAALPTVSAAAGRSVGGGGGNDPRRRQQQRQQLSASLREAKWQRGSWGVRPGHASCHAFITHRHVCACVTRLSQTSHTFLTHVWVTPVAAPSPPPAAPGAAPAPDTTCACVCVPTTHIHTRTRLGLSSGGTSVPPTQELGRTWHGQLCAAPALQARRSPLEWPRGQRRMGHYRS